MNYQHHYHAGNASDVFKHLVLLALLDYMKTKEKPFSYIDTHAGYAEYDLTHFSIQEWRTGVDLLHKHPVSDPLLQRYRQLTLDPTRFPGSPLIAFDALRDNDEMILSELADEAFSFLKKLFYKKKRVHVHHLDAYHLPHALLPPAIRRSLVFIDPPYEDPHEFEKLIIMLNQALSRLSTAIYAIWYPIKSRQLIKRFHSQLKKTISADMQVIECCPWPDDVPLRLNGSGMIIINPPWKFNEIIHPSMNELIQIIKQHNSAFWHVFTL